jgi:hypothetical protein
MRARTSIDVAETSVPAVGVAHVEAGTEYNGKFGKAS